MKKLLSIIFSIISITSLFLIIPIHADEPAQNGAQSLIANLSAEERQKIIDVAFAEHTLNVLRLSPSTVSYIGIIYTTESSGVAGHSYYHLILGANARSFSGISQTSITTSFHINSPATMYHYVWSDLDNGGWVFSNALESGVTTYNCTSVLFYRTVCGTSGQDYNLSQIESTQLSGSGTLGACAQSWIDCYNVKLNGLPPSGKYTQEEYDQHGQNQYLCGGLDRQNQILADPSIVNLYDADDLAYEKELSRQAGISSVCMNPNDYDLYTQAQVDEIRNDLISSSITNKQYYIYAEIRYATDFNLKTGSFVLDGYWYNQYLQSTSSTPLDECELSVFLPSDFDFSNFVPDPYTQIKTFVSNDFSDKYLIVDIEYLGTGSLDNTRIYEVIIADKPEGDFNQGYSAGLQDQSTLINGLGTIAAAPVKSIWNLLNFEMFGFRPAHILGILLTFVLGIFAYKKLKGLFL